MRSSSFASSASAAAASPPPVGSFPQLVGAAGDVRELEYISALVQTDQYEVREDASICAEDIRLFLSSRYGIDVTTEYVRSRILHGLTITTPPPTTTTDTSGGGRRGRGSPSMQEEEEDDDDDDAEGVVDLMELVALLLLPTFQKAANHHALHPNRENVNYHTTPKYYDESESLQSADIVPAPKGMIQYVLRMILHDVTGSSQPKRLTPELVQKILIAYGENELAQDENLLQEMVTVAATTTGDPNSATIQGNNDAATTITAAAAEEEEEKSDDTLLLLTEEAFAKALSYDIQLYDLMNETRMTTNMEDVFGPNGDEEAIVLNDGNTSNNNTNNNHHNGSNNDNKPSQLKQAVMSLASQLQEEEEATAYSNVSFKDEERRNNTGNTTHKKREIQQLEAAPSSSSSEQQQSEPNEILKRKRTFPSIDVTAGTYRSKTLVVVIWASFIISYFAYDYSFNRQFVDETECTGENEQFVYSYSRPWKTNEQAMACQTGHSIEGWLDEFWDMCWNGVLFISLGSIGNSIHCKRSWKPFVGFLSMTILSVGLFFWERQPHQERWILYVACLVLGLLAALLHLGHAVTIVFSPQRLKSCCPALYNLIQGTVVSEQISKQAAAQKIAQLVSNALEVVATKHSEESVLRTHYGRALTNYARNGKKYVPGGGHMWAWQRMLRLDQTSFAKEGIWINSRIIAGNIGQLVVVVYTLMGGIALTERVMNNFDEEWAKQQFRSFAERTFDKTMEDQDDLANALVSNVSTLVSGFLAQGSMADSLLSDGGGGCLDMINNGTTEGLAVEDILNTYCNNSLVDDIELNLSMFSTSATQQFRCDPSAPVNYLCPLLNATVSGNLNATSQQALLGGSGFDSDLLEQIVRDAMYQAADDSVESLYPAEKYMVMVPMIVGVTIASITCAYLALSYIPSVATTILKLRCGHIATLRNPEFNRFRRAPDQVCMLTGSIFWGTLVSGLVVGGTVGLVVFFFVWQATAYFAQRLLAIVIGIVAVTLFRLFLVSLCRFRLYKSFYRERPGLANVLFLALEWAVFALSVGFIFARMIKLMLAAGMSIGRIDTPFLAPGIGRIGALELDNYPMIHLKDVLSHEAHRHPYIEQLGVLFLMKLRHGSRFGQRAGTCWRLIFVHALLPWLHKYRVLTRTMQQLAAKEEEEEVDDGPEEDKTGMPLMMDYPSLTFKSLRNFEADSTNDDKHPLQVDTAPPPALFGTGAIAVDERGNNNEEEDAQAKRIQQLEAENRQLKEALAKATLLSSFDC